MLRCFFEDTGDPETNQTAAALFQGLKIMQAGDACLAHQNRYPVISLTLKSAKQPTWELAYACMKDEIRNEFKRHRQVMEQLPVEEDRRRYSDIMNLKGQDPDYVTALAFLSNCLHQIFQKPVVILIDEYDVPLENAYFKGFYDQMVSFIRSLFESALKTNPYLAFAVITGCLRISRESIFTGLNNLETNSILDVSYDEYFGFSQEEVDALLQEYQLETHRESVKKWYDGYRFGGNEIYNPWSVSNYIKTLCSDPAAFPLPYWANTSSNSIVRSLVEHADASVKAELETLMAGGTIEKMVHEDITYDSVYDSEDNLWNFLFFTGYLRQTATHMQGRDRLVSLNIPNEEVAYIYENTITGWFRDRIRTKDLTPFYQALTEGNAETVQRELSLLLQESISYLDEKEAFYHGFLLGILRTMRDWIVRSNREAGSGRLDIVVRHPDVSYAPMIFELKAADRLNQLEVACQKALDQIEEKSYDAWAPEEGYTEVLHYGIAFFRKQCRVKVVRKQF